VEVRRLYVLGSVSNGILFKSASTRGGTVENIVIHDMDIQDVHVAIGVELNWNPSFSYAKLPEGTTNVPDYWRVLLTPVPPELGLPHIRNVQISGIHAAGAGRAFAVRAYADSPLQNFTFRDLDIAAKVGGQHSERGRLEIYEHANSSGRWQPCDRKRQPGRNGIDGLTAIRCDALAARRVCQICRRLSPGYTANGRQPWPSRTLRTQSAH